MRVAVIILAAMLCVAADEIKPAFELTPVVVTVLPVEYHTAEFQRILFAQIARLEIAIKKLTPAQLRHLADALNQTAEFEAYKLGRLTRHSTAPENYLYIQILRIREVAKTDTAKAEQMINAVVEHFRRFGVEL
jgi:hypothetical protein